VLTDLFIIVIVIFNGLISEYMIFPTNFQLGLRHIVSTYRIHQNKRPSPSKKTFMGGWKPKKAFETPIGGYFKEYGIMLALSEIALESDESLTPLS